MGFLLTNIYSIASDDKHEFFVFYVGHHFNDTVSRWIDGNFAATAKALGPNAAIVRGLSDEFDQQVIQAYENDIRTVFTHGRWNKPELLQAIDDLLIHYRGQYGLAWNRLLPLLFVTDKNPNQVTTESDSGIFYLVPLGEIESETEVRNIIQTIIACVQSGKFARLEELLREKFGNPPLDLLKAANQSLELKPNIAGIGINLNGLIELMTRGRK